MTELDKLKKAQLIIEKLANGLNPSTGELVPEEEIINDVKISRCFFYISDVLKNLIVENEKSEEQLNGVTKNHPILPFSLTKDQVSTLQTSPKPISCSEIAKYLNSFIDQSIKEKITPNMINSWLLHLGLLTINIDDDGRKRKCPTDQGQSFGITTARRFSKYGSYAVTVYNEDAQQFIYDNIDAIASFKYKPDLTNM